MVSCQKCFLGVTACSTLIGQPLNFKPEKREAKRRTHQKFQYPLQQLAKTEYSMSHTQLAIPSTLIKFPRNFLVSFFQNTSPDRKEYVLQLQQIYSYLLIFWIQILRRILRSRNFHGNHDKKDLFAVETWENQNPFISLG